jgi:hypothetical protein
MGWRRVGSDAGQRALGWTRARQGLVDGPDGFPGPFDFRVLRAFARPIATTEHHPPPLAARRILEESIHGRVHPAPHARYEYGKENAIVYLSFLES